MIFFKKQFIILGYLVTIKEYNVAGEYGLYALFDFLF